MYNLSFFNKVDEKLLNKVTLHTKRYSKNQVIYSVGDTCQGMDIVISGHLASYSLLPNGSQNIIFSFGPDSVLGANLLFGNANHYPMTIYCKEACELLHLSKSDVELLLTDYHFMMHFIQSISLNSEGMSRKILMYTQKSLRQNLLDYFYMLSSNQQSATITLPISKKQLADHLGVQRPSLFRELKRLKDEGILEVHNHSITLKKEQSND